MVQIVIVKKSLYALRVSGYLRTGCSAVEVPDNRET